MLSLNIPAQVMCKKQERNQLAFGTQVVFITPAAKCPGMLLLPKQLTCSRCLHNVDRGMPCVSAMNSCVLLWHIGLPHSFHPLRVSQALRRDCSIPFKLHGLQHRTHLPLQDRAGENESNRQPPCTPTESSSANICQGTQSACSRKEEQADSTENIIADLTLRSAHICNKQFANEEEHCMTIKPCFTSICGIRMWQ